MTDRPSKQVTSGRNQWWVIDDLGAFSTTDARDIKGRTSAPVVYGNFEADVVAELRRLRTDNERLGRIEAAARAYVQQWDTPPSGPPQISDPEPISVLRKALEAKG